MSMFRDLMRREKAPPKEFIITGVRPNSVSGWASDMIECRDECQLYFHFTAQFNNPYYPDYKPTKFIWSGGYFNFYDGSSSYIGPFTSTNPSSFYYENQYYHYCYVGGYIPVAYGDYSSNGSTNGTATIYYTRVAK